MKIQFLIHNAYGIGGTIRSTVNLSQALAERHEVEVVSVHRVADEPRLALDPRVRLRSLVDMREDAPGYEGDHELTARPNTMFPDAGVDFGKLRYTALHEERIAALLRTTDADVVVATRPILNGYLARYGQSRCLRIGQEHLSLGAHSAQLRADQNAAVAGLDAFLTVSEADAEQYRAALPEAKALIACVPNGVPAPQVEPSSLDSKVIVAAGRLVAVKRYDRLVEAFAVVAEEFPEWTLRLYGRGPEKPRLRRLIDEAGLYNRVFLMGAVSPIETEWAKGALAAVSSDQESFGMTIVEAMHCGVPVVATDCPHGPAEMISHEEDGLLVPLTGDARQDVTAYAAALRDLMSDAALRRRLGDAAREKAAVFAPEAAAARYEEIFRSLGPQGADSAKEIATDARKDGRANGSGTTGGGLLRRMRSAFGGRQAQAGTDRAASSSRSGSGSQPRPPVRPLAYARATDDGGVQIRLRELPLPAAELDFVARLRRDPRQREIRTPLVTAPDGVRAEVGVSLKHGEHLLAEGRWDCYVAPRGRDKRVRLVAGLAEQARLLGLPPVLDAQGVAAWIPYATEDGFLALRTWRRGAHAEIESVQVAREGATVTARLLTLTELRPGQGELRAASREGDTLDFRVPVEELGDGAFRFTLPYDQALARRAAEQDVWDLTLLPVPGGTPVTLGRITGDGVDRKKTDVFPAELHEHPDRGTTRLRPFFTVHNNLALSAKDVTEAVAGDADGG
ncbi:glycosyltransferase family 4 protein [Streptomyces sp. NA04227]|uniref:glycosyltransferase family 4 protein n=1 Tax=Streptomyces sp. NA04227 TaxID=2742136 RepID=UPI0015905F2C|nr:glycosyltransferase family 4 protein [Streptomyces sp. NA04227]QKW06178.1 glycosyltransferase family 4 protein [Streptomyces sp. NA04227]